VIGIFVEVIDSNRAQLKEINLFRNEQLKEHNLLGSQVTADDDYRSYFEDSEANLVDIPLPQK
jgi:hypothetical protein